MSPGDKIALFSLRTTDVEGTTEELFMKDTVTGNQRGRQKEESPSQKK
jgi:hypothetical protein